MRPLCPGLKLRGGQMIYSSMGQLILNIFNHSNNAQRSYFYPSLSTCQAKQITSLTNSRKVTGYLILSKRGYITAQICSMDKFEQYY